MPGWYRTLIVLRQVWMRTWLLLPIKFISKFYPCDFKFMQEGSEFTFKDLRQGMNVWRRRVYVYLDDAEDTAHSW